MVLLGQTPQYISHQGPSRRNLLIALAVGLAVCLGIGAVAVSAFNDKPLFHDDVAYEGGYVVALAGMKADPTGKTQGFLKSGGCEQWRHEQGGPKAAASRSAGSRAAVTRPTTVTAGMDRSRQSPRDPRGSEASSATATRESEGPSRADRPRVSVPVCPCHRPSAP